MAILRVAVYLINSTHKAPVENGLESNGIQ